MCHEWTSKGHCEQAMTQKQEQEMKNQGNGDYAHAIKTSETMMLGQDKKMWEDFIQPTHFWNVIFKQKSTNSVIMGTFTKALMHRCYVALSLVPLI